MNDLSTVLNHREQEVAARLYPLWQPETETEVLGAGNLFYKMADELCRIAAGGIGLVEQLVDAIGFSSQDQLLYQETG